MNNKTMRELAQITDPVPERMMQKRMAWVKVKEGRNQFIKSLKDKGITGKNYSDAMVTFDKDMPERLW